MPNSAQRDSDLWRGVDLSGITLVLGPAGGQLVNLLAEQAQRAGGLVLVASYNRSGLTNLKDVVTGLPVERLVCRQRALPLLEASVDLCVVNGSLRDVPVRYYPLFLAELWRVLVPGGHLRISDLLPPSEEESGKAWQLRSGLIEVLGRSLGRPVAIHANARALAEAMQQTGFESMAVSLLPGYALTDAWLSDTIEAVRLMVSRIADAQTREEILQVQIPALIAAFREGHQRAAERFVMRGNKVGNLALDMETAGTEDLLAARDEEPTGRESTQGDSL